MNGVDVRPEWVGWPGAANIFAAIAEASEAFVSNALILRHTVGAGMTEAAVRHVPAMQERARGQGIVPGERRQATGGTIMVDQLEE